MKICVLGDRPGIFDFVEILLEEGHEVFHLGEEPAHITHRRFHSYLFHYDNSWKLKECEWWEIDYVVALTGNDERNILWTLLLKKRGVKRGIVEILDYDTYREVRRGMDEFPIDEYVNLAATIGATVDKYMEEDGAIPGESFWDGRLEICRHTVEDGENIAGVRLMDTEELDGMLVVSIYRNRNFFVPDGKTVIQPGDKLYLIGKKKDVLKFKATYRDEELFGKKKRFWVLGDNYKGKEIVGALLARGYEVKLTISHREDVKRLRHSLPEAFVEYGDLTMLRTYEEEDGPYHGVICASEDDDKNVVMALLAHTAGWKNIMTVLSNRDYDKMTEGLPISLQIRPRLGITGHLLRLVRGKSDLYIHQVLGGTTEVLELSLPANSKSLGRPLSELSLPKEVIISGILRKDEVTIPTGSTFLEEGDRLLIFCARANRHRLLGLLSVKDRGLLAELLERGGKYGNL